MLQPLEPRSGDWSTLPQWFKPQISLAQAVDLEASRGIVDVAEKVMNARRQKRERKENQRLERVKKSILRRMLATLWAQPGYSLTRSIPQTSQP